MRLFAQVSAPLQLSQKMKQKEIRSTRKQVIADPTVQGELLFRALVYWFLCLTMIVLSMLGWSLWSGPPRSLGLVIQQTLVTAVPAILGSTLLLPQPRSR